MNTTAAFRRWAYATAGRYVGPNDVDDLAQEALLAIELKLREVPTAGARLLATVGKHAMINYLRTGTGTGSMDPGTRKFRPDTRSTDPVDDLWSSLTTPDPTAGTAASLDLIAALSELDSRDQLLALMYAAGYDRKTMTERSGYASAKSMDRRLLQVLKGLRRALDMV